MKTDVRSSGYPRRRADGIETSRAGDELTVRDLAGDRVTVLNATAAALWELCDGETAPAEMVDGLAVLFAADRAQLAADVAEVLDELTALDLLTWASLPAFSDVALRDGTDRFLEEL